MTLTYLNLVNQLCQKVNEVELNSSNFAGAGGFYAVCKSAVNRTISEINSQQVFWRFNWKEGAYVLNAGQSRLAWPSNAKVIDFDSFRISGSTSIVEGAVDRNWWEDSFWLDDTNASTFYTYNQTSDLEYKIKWLRKLNYDQFNKDYAYLEYDTGARNVPYFVCDGPSYNVIVHPTPVERTPLLFDYYVKHTDLNLFDDEPTIPDEYREVIYLGALRDVYDFREDEQQAMKFEEKFRDAVADMRREHLNKYEYVQSPLKWR